MAERLDVNNHGIECLKLAAIIPDSSFPSRYSFRTQSINSLTGQYDTITTSYPDDVTEIYYCRTGGVSGTINKTITIIYSDLTKNRLVSMVAV